MSRPSHKEISKKTAQAKSAIASGNISILNMLSLVADADELGYVIEDDLDGLLMELLGKSCLDNYAGTRPPQKAYQQEVQGAELFAFVIEKTSLNGPIYYKFSIVDDFMFLISLHRDRKE